MAGVDAQRAAVGRQFLDVEHVRPWCGEDPLGSTKREVGEVLVVDRVELVARDEPQQVRELERDHAAAARAGSSARDEVVEIGDVGQHVVADEQVGRACPRRRAARRGVAPKNRQWSARPSATAALATLAAGSMPSTGRPRRRSTGAGSRRCWPTSTTRLSRPRPKRSMHLAIAHAACSTQRRE